MMMSMIMLVMVIMMMMTTTMMIMICAPLSAVTYNSLVFKVQQMPLKYSHLHYLPVLKYQFGVGGRDVRLNITS